MLPNGSVIGGYKPPHPPQPSATGVYDVVTIPILSQGVETIHVTDTAALVSTAFVCVESMGVYDSPNMPIPIYSFSQTETIGDRDSLVTVSNGDYLSVTDSPTQQLITFVQNDTIGEGDSDKLTSFSNTDNTGISDSGVQLKP